MLAPACPLFGTSPTLTAAGSQRVADLSAVLCELHFGTKEWASRTREDLREYKQIGPGAASPKSVAVKLLADPSEEDMLRAPLANDASDRQASEPVWSEVPNDRCYLTSQPATAPSKLGLSGPGIAATPIEQAIIAPDQTRASPLTMMDDATPTATPPRVRRAFLARFTPQGAAREWLLSIEQLELQEEPDEAPEPPPRSERGIHDWVFAPAPRKRRASFGNQKKAPALPPAGGRRAFSFRHGFRRFSRGLQRSHTM